MPRIDLPWQRELLGDTKSRKEMSSLERRGDYANEAYLSRMVTCILMRRCGELPYCQHS